MKKKVRYTIGGMIAAAAVIATALPALAEGNGIQVGEFRELRLEAASPASPIGWTGEGGDSPIDTNSRALKTVVATGEFTDAYSNASLDLDRLVGNVHNLSWDEKIRTDGTHGAGAPRISAVFSNGDVAFLASSTCAHPIAVSSGTWQRADFTGFVNNCSFTVSGATTGTYAANGTLSAWEVYAAAWPTQRVSYTFIVFDEPGFYRVDRVSLGRGMYNYGLHRMVECFNDETRC